MNLSITEEKRIKTILKAHSARLGYIFGSFAQKTAHGGSDLDVAVLLPETFSKSNRTSIRFALAQDLERVCKRPVDIIILNDTSSILFSFIILQEGYCLYRISEIEQLEYELKVMNQYYDFEPFLTMYNKEYVKRSV